MHLFKCPPEILDLIFDELDPTFFSDDTGRLTVSKQWYSFALPRYLTRLTVKSTRQLLHLVKTADDHATAIARYKPFLEAADLTIDGVGRSLSAMPGVALDMVALHDSVRGLDHGFRAVIALLNRCTRLQTLRLRLGPEKNCGSEIQALFEMAGGYCNIDRVIDTFTVRLGHLTSLELDLAGGRSSSGIMPEPENPDRGHVCIQLHKVLPSLRRFHCRMDRICPRLVDFDEKTVSDWPLEEMIINLSLQDFPIDHFYYRSDDEPPCRVPVDCRSGAAAREDPLMVAVILREDIEGRMVELGGKFEKNRNGRMPIIRTIWDVYPEELSHLPWQTPPPPPDMTLPYDIMAVDSITCRLVKLKPGDAWDAEGELVDDGKGGRSHEEEEDQEVEDIGDMDVSMFGVEWGQDI